MGKWVRILFAMGALALAGFLWVANCTGADPVVQNVSVQPSTSGEQFYIVRATLYNASNNPGQVSLSFSLRSKSDGTVYTKDDSVSLEAHQHVEVSQAVYAPPGDYVPKVDAQYPPR